MKFHVSRVVFNFWWCDPLSHRRCTFATDFNFSPGPTRMVLELHVWGSAFGLPSIDAQCLAAIFYLRNCVPSGAWVLVPSSDPTTSPLGDLPALRDGATWRAGFDNIVDHLRTINSEWDLDGRLDAAQRAECIAFSSFVVSRGQPLLDLSLYVSSDNYFNCTRAALSDILVWPGSWTIPHHLREKAKRRSEHLGLSALDVDTANEDKEEQTGLTAHIPKSLRKPKQTVSGLLGKTAQKTRFRLDAVTSDFLDPLSEVLGEKKWFLGDCVSTLDCLALGYLSLMQLDGLQQHWLNDALTERYQKLNAWTHSHRVQAFGLQGGYTKGTSVLPWQSPSQRSVLQLVQSVLENSIGSIPVLGAVYSVSEVSTVLGDSSQRQKKKQLQLARMQRQRDRYVQAIATSFAATGLLGWLLYNGYLQFPRFSMKPRRRDFGEAGALLGLV